MLVCTLPGKLHCAINSSQSFSENPFRDLAQLKMLYFHTYLLLPLALKEVIIVSSVKYTLNPYFRVLYSAHHCSAFYEKLIATAKSLVDFMDSDSSQDKNSAWSIFVLF